MSDEIKVKADEIRLDLLRQLHCLVNADVNAVVGYSKYEAVLAMIEQETRALNQLEPHGCGMLEVKPALIEQADAATSMSVTGEAMATEPGQALRAAAAELAQHQPAQSDAR